MEGIVDEVPATRDEEDVPDPPVASPDARLMRRVAAGDVTAFEQVYDRHATVAFAIAMGVLHDRRGSEDVCQEAFFAVWRSAGKFDAARGSLRSWLLRIVRNRAIDAARSRSVPGRQLEPREHLLEHEPAAERTEAQAIGNLQAATARAAIHTLPDEQRQAIVLSFYGGLTHTEIATHIEQPLGTVKGRVRLGLQKLHGPVAAGGAR